MDMMPVSIGPEKTAGIAMAVPIRSMTVVLNIIVN